MLFGPFDKSLAMYHYQWSFIYSVGLFSYHEGTLKIMDGGFKTRQHDGHTLGN